MDDGYFPPGRSVLRRVHAERAVGLLYGQRALMVGAMDPLTYTGTSLRTGAKEAPWQRLAHTAKVFETIFFGSRDDADEALAFVHTLHQRVKGTLPEDAGPWRAGTPYSAYDPELMLWTLAVLADSGRFMYETFVRSLSEEEREALWQEYILFGELFGMPRDVAPPTYPDFRAWFEDRLSSDRVHLTEEARTAGLNSGFNIPVPFHSRPGMAVIEFLTLGSLPQRARELYGLSWNPIQEAAFRAIAIASRRSRTFLPSLVRRGTCQPFFDLVAGAERKRLQAGKPSVVIPVSG
jgi:uncharacterized protein (DUF2236 family)